MSNICKRIFCLILCVLFVAEICPAFAQSDELNKRFDSSDNAAELSDKWKLPDNSEFREDGLHDDSGFGAMLLYNAAEWSEKYEYEAEFCLPFMNSGRVLFNYVDTKNCNYVEVSPKSKTIAIKTVVNQVRYTVAETKISDNLTNDTIYRVKILSNGGDGISVEMSTGKNMVTYFQDEYAMETNKVGKVGFYANDNPLHVISVSAKEIGKSDYEIPKEEGTSHIIADGKDDMSNHEENSGAENGDDGQESIDLMPYNELVKMGIMNDGEDAGSDLTTAEYNDIMDKLKWSSDADGEYVRMRDIIKDTVDMLGYGGIVDPKNSYYQQAAKLKLFDGVTLTKDRVKRYAAAQILYNAFFVEIMTGTYWTNGKVTYHIERGRRLLDDVIGIRCIKGICEDDGINSLSGKTETGKESVKIGGNIYKYSADWNAEFLGRYVRAYIKESDDGMDEAFLIEPMQNAKCITIMAKDYVGFENNVLRYIAENGRTKEVRLAPSVPVLQNGSYVSSYDSDIFKINRGKIVISADTSGKVIAVMIYSYDVEYVENVNAEKIKLQKMIDDGMFDVVQMFYRDKTAFELNMLKEGDVVHIMKNDRSLILVISAEQVINFDVKNLWKNNEEISVSDGTGQYSVRVCNADELLKSRLQPNNKLNLYFDIFDEIVYAGISEENVMMYGCLVDVAISEEAFSNKIKMLVYKEDSEKRVYEINKKVNYCDENGSVRRLKPEELYGELKGKNTMISYKISDKGEISYIEMPVLSYEKNSEAQLTMLVDENTSRNYIYRSIDTSFGHRWYVAETTKSFIVSSGDKRDISEYTIREGTGIYIYNTDYKFKAFSKRGDITADFVILYDRFNTEQLKPSFDENLLYVTEIASAINDDGEIKTVLTFGNGEVMYADDAAVENCYDMYTIADAEPKLHKLNVGDVVTVNQNPIDDEIKSFMIVYRPVSDDGDCAATLFEGEEYSSSERSNPYMFDSSYARQSNNFSIPDDKKYTRIFFGWVYRVDNNVIEVTTQNLRKTGYDKYNEQFVTERYRINFYRNPAVTNCMYNFDRKKVGDCRKAEITDFRSYEDYGKECSAVVVSCTGDKYSIVLLNDVI